ncbi:DUF1934 family protein [Candidatus Stoquefichus massiliensis]|uniref:DUF1934 family protein n=1 Tax=Candidatus Stoquefichus massiliensis TaxID=1470350 RepID=UPI00047F4743|nr:DUF1934 family protein [Candidatus Stoquefichus massiliensis]
MYQTKNIHYKAIFKQDNEIETIEYKTKGIMCTGKQTQVSFETKEGTISITYGKEPIILNHGSSTLTFHFGQETWNDYQLPYGSVPLKTKLLKFEANDDRIKMKYELHDQRGLISTVYLMVTLLSYSFQEEL